MPNPSENPIKITLEDLEHVTVAETKLELTAAVAGENKYGSIKAAEESLATGQERGSILLQGWFYLGASGLVAALIGWGICEPWFVDGPSNVERWGNIALIPVLVATLCVAFGVAESVVERSAKKAVQRAALALPLGAIFGFILSFLANIVYSIGIMISVQAGAASEKNPALWIARALGWMVFGLAGGAVYGIVGWSGKKAGYGMLGGVIGAGLGGLVFDPISLVTHGGALSRGVGFALTGMATGIGIGVIESALKDRWLYVTSGPLAGKQFILYKPVTTVGSSQQCDIYLFKDSNILPNHAVLENRGSRLQLSALGTVYVAGVPVQRQVLQSGTILQIGRYGFRYQEKQR
jgi:Inner membrane component of T3SS, cytoplasmic domain